MKVALISSPNNGIFNAVLGAKICKKNKPIEDIINDIIYMSEYKRQMFIHRIVKQGHESIVEHLNFTFAIEGISRACSHQLVRHRIASYSQRSQRYVDESNCNFVLPHIEDEYTKEYFKDTIDIVSNLYKNVSSNNRLKIDKEDIRYLLPNATETTILVTMNARSLLNFFRLRLCKQAQWEIRELAEEMYNLVASKFEFFKEGLPKCSQCVNKDTCKGIKPQ